MSLATRITSLVTRLADEFKAVRAEQIEHIYWNSTTDTWPAHNPKYAVHHWHSEHDSTAIAPSQGESGKDIWWKALV